MFITNFFYSQYSSQKLANNFAWIPFLVLLCNKDIIESIFLKSLKLQNLIHVKYFTEPSTAKLIPGEVKHFGQARN